MDVREEREQPYKATEEGARSNVAAPRPYFPSAPLVGIVGGGAR
jgi:hypothetical protein